MLIGAPVSHYHLYCTGAYLKSLQSLTYNNYDICLVDNSPTDKFYNLLKEKRINVIRKDMKDKTIREKIIDCRNVLREKVLDEGYDYFFSVEQDILLPKNADFHFNLGLTYHQLGMKKEAYFEFKETVSLNPSYKEVVNFGN